MVTYPSDWKEDRVSNVVEISTGCRDTQDNKATGRYPFFVRSPIVERIDVADYDCEAVLTAGDGVGTGKVFHYYNGKFAAHQRVYVMNNFREVDGKYFYYFFSKNFIKEVEKYTAKSSVDSVRRAMIADMEFTHPQLPEQQDIVRVLTAFDSYIADLAELIEKKRGIRDGALEDLIRHRTRLDGFNDEWSTVSFNQVITPKARIGWQGLKKHEYLRSGYSYLIGGTDFSHGTVSLDNIWHVSKERYDMDANIQVSENDVLVTKDGTIGKVALVPELGKPATLNSGVFVFRTNNRLLPTFLFRVLSSSVFREFIDTLSAGSTIKHLYQKDLKNFEFEIPVDKKEQEAIANTLTAMDEEIEALEIERDKMIQIREGAMDDLLTGRVRLSI
ncbi:MAG: restriction endonuclease subunit S [Acutalibacteraceae bacterium]|nr:restriction endonuclease subunit S [Acutalibacteraceae bacterium]